MDLFQCWHYGLHRILRTEPCHFGGGFFNIVMFGRRNSGCAPSKTKWFLAPHLTNFLTAAQKEVPRNLRDPEVDGRLGEREKPQPACKIAASTRAEAGERPRCPGRAARLRRGAAPSPEREVPQATSDSAQIAAAPRGHNSGDRRMDGRTDGWTEAAAQSSHRGRARPRAPSHGARRNGGRAPEGRKEGTEKVPSRPGPLSPLSALPRPA